MTKDEAEIEPVHEGEIVTDVSEGGEPGGTRTLRVYRRDDDFLLEVPSESTVTFGYFNPAAAGRSDVNQFGGGGGAHTMKTTCLRVYEGKSSKTPQLGAFLGVDGFRDLRLKLTKLRKRVVIESNFEDDGNHQRAARDVQRQLAPINEDDDVPF